MRNTIKPKVGYVIWYRRKEPNKVTVCDGDDVLFRWKDQITMPKAKIKQMIEQYKQQGYKEVED